MGNVYYDVHVDRNEAEKQHFLMDKIFTKTLSEIYLFVFFITKWEKLCLSPITEPESRIIFNADVSA